MIRNVVIGAMVAVVLLIPASFLLGFHCQTPSVDFGKIEAIIKRNAGPTFGPDVYESSCRRAVEDYFREHPAPVCDHEGILQKIEEIVKNVVRDALKDIKDLGHDVVNDLEGKHYEWRQDAANPNVWLYGYWCEKDNVFYYSYYYVAGQPVNRCEGWKICKKICR